jgi:hypothetical protein
VSHRYSARRWARWAVLVALALALPVVPHAAVAAPAPALIVRTMPPVPNTRVLFDGRELRTGPDGTLRIVPGNWGELRRRISVPTVWRDGTRARFSRWIGRIDQAVRPTRDLEVAAAFDVDYLVQFRFVGPEGKPVPYDRIDHVELRGATGVVVKATGERLRRPLLLWGSRVITLHAGPRQKDIYYRLQSVRMRGANVVNQAQQRYIPSTDRSVRVKLLFFDAEVVVRDALFGFPIGKAVRVRYPDGSRERYRLGPGREVTLRSLPRAPYDLTVEGLGLPIASPVAITRTQTIPLKFVSWLDVAVGLLVALTFLIGLPLLGRRMLRHPRPSSGSRDGAGKDLTNPVPGQRP